MSRFQEAKAGALPDVADVREVAGLEVVDADHAVLAREQVVAQVRAEEAAAAGDEARGHEPRLYL